MIRDAVLVFVILFAATAPSAQAPDAARESRIAPIFRAAREAERAGNFERAAALYDEVLRLAPDIAEVWTNKGLVLHELGRRREALAAFTKASSLKPRLSVPQMFMGIEWLELGRPREAVPPLETALKLDPGNPRIRYELGRAMAQSGDFRRGVALLRDLVVSGPEQDDARYALGLAYLNWSRETARQVVESDSGYSLILRAEADAISGLAAPAAEKFRAGMAKLSPAERTQLPVNRETFETITAPPQTDYAAPAGLAPGAADLDTIAAKSWKAGQYEKALRAASLRARQTKDPRALYWLALSCRALARETFLRAVERNPKTARAYLLLGELARETGDKEGALSAFRNAVAAEPRNAEVRLIYVQYLGAVRPDEVLENARGAVSLFPTHAGLNTEFGKALLKSGSSGDAVRVFTAALKSDPGLAAARAGLADAYAAAGDLPSAIREMQRALTADTDGSYHYRIGRWYQQTGRNEEARAAFAETARIKAKTIKGLEGRLGSDAPRK